ncbi:MAG: NTP transferase domain-containing protein [Saprospiraceae bacterium]|nr:NTP transferase domain-containing protein [Saprospiraceae bacterium]
MKLKGLLLCGGRSSRLGLDKSLLEIDGQQVYNRWIEYFTSFQIDLYISCKPEQVSNYNHHLIIVDKHDQLGPLSGLVAAIHNDASCHWFIVSVDLLYITKNDINYLLSKYKKEYFACCFQDANSIIYPLFSLISL